MPDLQGLRSTAGGRLLLTLAGIGGGAALGSLVAVAAIFGRWPGQWGLPEHEVPRLLFLFCVGVGVTLGSAVGIVLAGNLGFIGFVGMLPALVITAYEFAGVGRSMSKGTYFLVTVPALAVVGVLLLALVPVLKRGADRDDTWMWRVTWARLRGKPLPPLPESLRPHPGRVRQAKQEAP
jgi:hypothetical protein